MAIIPTIAKTNVVAALPETGWPPLVVATALVVVVPQLKEFVYQTPPSSTQDS